MTEVTDQLVFCSQSQAYEVKYRTGMYVRVHGHIRSFDNQMSMNCFKIRPITDFNEARCRYLVTSVWVWLHWFVNPGTALLTMSAMCCRSPTTAYSASSSTCISPRATAVPMVQDPHRLQSQ